MISYTAMCSAIGVNLQRLPGNNLDALLIERVAARIAKFDVVDAWAQGKLLQFSGLAGVAAVDEDPGVLVIRLDLQVSRVGNQRVRRAPPGTVPGWDPPGA